ncbi:MAG: sigma-70 family RNA polymerase sigma factor [Deltaproteobacteria bacterium]|nr:sigma-70 family RNA polymerase sigma factor [Deltaproteobacteria bacterium]
MEILGLIEQRQIIERGRHVGMIGARFSGRVTNFPYVNSPGLGTFAAAQPLCQLMDTVLALRYYDRVLFRDRNQSKESESFAAELLGHLDHLYRVASHLAKDRDRANECVQETVLRALNARQQFEPGTNMKAWLTKILHNFFIDSYNRVKNIIPIEPHKAAIESGAEYWDNLATHEPGPDSHFLQAELRDEIRTALQKIPEEFRAPIVLVDMGDFSYVEAAEILSCPVGTIRSRLSRGRRLLYRHLKNYVSADGK